MTKTVTISALRADSTPYAHHDVIVTLVAGSAGGVVGSNVIVESSKVRLDANGAGSVVLETNEAITSPTTSFYRLTVEGSSPTITRSIRLTNALASTVSWTLAGIQVGDPTTPDRDVSSDYVTVGGQSLTNYLAGLKVFHPDAAFRPVDTLGTYPESDIDPINDTAAWVTAGGPAFFNVSTGDVVAINNADFDPTTTGIYNWNGTTFTRHPDYTTTVSLDTLFVISDVHHSHFSGVPLATAIPLAAMFFADDIDAPLGTAEFVTKIFTDIDSVIELIQFLGGGGVALGETSTTAYRGDRGKTAYDHTSLTNNPHSVTAAQVGAASNAAVPFKAQVGDWVSEPHDGIYAATQTLNRVAYVPWLVPAGFAQTDGIAVEVTTVATSALCRLGIYLPHATTGRPGALVVDGGTVDFSSGGGAAGIRTLTITATNLTPGSLIYVAVVPQGATAAARHTNTGEVLRSYGYASSTVADVFRANGASAYYEGSVTGALPANATPLIGSIVGQPVVALRRSA